MNNLETELNRGGEHAISTQNQYLIQIAAQMQQDLQNYKDRKYKAGIGTCGDCGEMSVFEYVGLQKREDNLRVELYHCSNCDTARPKSVIRNYAPVVE